MSKKVEKKKDELASMDEIVEAMKKHGLSEDEIDKIFDEMEQDAIKAIVKKLQLEDVEETPDEIDETIKVGDKVHLGVGAKGGTGFRGKVIKLEGNQVHIEHESAKDMTGRPKVYKGSQKFVTKEDFEDEANKEPENKPEETPDGSVEDDPFALSNLINATINQEPAKMAEIFDVQMKQRLGTKVDELKTNLAQRMFDDPEPDPDPDPEPAGEEDSEEAEADSEPEAEVKEDHYKADGIVEPDLDSEPNAEEVKKHANFIKWLGRDANKHLWKSANPSNEQANKKAKGE